MAEIIKDGAEKEQRTSDMSVSVLRVFLARRSCHLFGHRRTDRDEEIARAARSQNQVSADETRLSQRLVLGVSVSYHMEYVFYCIMLTMQSFIGAKL